jgi:hypothetical protein
LSGFQHGPSSVKHVSERVLLLGAAIRGGGRFAEPERAQTHGGVLVAPRSRAMNPRGHEVDLRLAAQGSSMARFIAACERDECRTPTR